MKTFKAQLNELSDFALEISDVKNDYTEDDMANAMLIFLEVLASLAYDEHKPKLTEAQLLELFIECGKSIHQTILVFTGIDLKNT